ncbi:MAG TPA: S8 family serine peptidase [Rhodanobacteraceae bacterium]|nr:S8 family serine peptidase [Rhodanobacteraceae bacterium]
MSKGNSLRSTSLASAIGFALLGASAAFASPAMAGTQRIVSPEEADRRGVYIVRFVEPGLVHYAGGTQGLRATAPETLGERKLDVHSAASNAYAGYLEAQRASHVAAIAQAIGRSLDVTHSYRVTMNGIAAEMSLDEARRIGKLPGVASVRLAPDRETTTYHGPEFIGAPKIWDGSGVPGAVGTRGQGVVVGVIDTGANSTHPSFADDPTCGVFDATNHKLLSAVDCLTTNGAGQCVGANPEANANNGHGVHTASTAIGNTLDASANPAPALPAGFTTMSGVAPCASVRTYKVCATNNCTGAAIEAAIESAIADQVDVINFSISGGSDPWSDDDRTFLDAVGANAFVAASAGNTGAVVDPVGAVNHLGPWMTTVAASTHDLNVSGTGLLDATGPGTPPPEVQNIAATPGSGLDPGPALAGVEIRHYAANETGCTAGGGFPPGYFDEAVALISRGDCTFEEKIGNAQAAGALVAIVYNNAPGTISMSVGGASLPAYSIQATEGQAFVAFIDGNGAPPVDRVFADGFEDPVSTGPALVDFTPAAQQGDVLADFSLRGPSALASVTKPDIAGPGVGIYAASDPAAGNYQYLSGTSMSSPHIAGSAALIRAAHPDWTPPEIKSALMLTAVTDGHKEDGVTSWTPDDVGSGRVDLSRAALAGFVLDESFANFVAANPATSGDPKTLNLASARNLNCVGSCTFTRTLRNTLTTASAWTVTVTNPAGLDVTVDTPAFSFTGDIAETKTIQITATPTTTLIRPAFAEIVFHEANGAAPDAHVFVAIEGSIAGGGSIVEGVIDEDVLNDGNGSTFDFVTANWGVYDGVRIDDVNLYNFGGGMYVYWYADLTAIPGGGVVDGGGVEFAVLQPGDTVGPGSTFSSEWQAMTDWAAGTDGYVGVAFQNEATGMLNYGYIHLTTSGPDGFPAHALEYGYDNSGAAITIPVP